MRVMIEIFCRERHGNKRELCPSCEGLWQYCLGRIERCPFYPDKPTCKNCKIHCYSAARRQEIQEVMRIAGPRMMWRAPVLALLHILDGAKGAPSKAPKAAKR